MPPYPVYFVDQVPLAALTFQSLLASDYANEEWLTGLSNNIAKQGLVNPLLVYNHGEHKLWIAIGNSRYMAIKMLGWEHVPCVVTGTVPSELLAIPLRTPEEIQARFRDGHVRFRTDGITLGGTTPPEKRKYPRDTTVKV